MSEQRPETFSRLMTEKRLVAFKRSETIQRSEALKLSSASGPTATIPWKIAGSILGFGKFTKVTK